ncbi:MULTISPECIES: 1-phosphofructokinase [unclassified Paludibacterium]|uniref:1-phosphofructokinase n=1 Tax=unclassified Paludibacterium TaxID=2618429 RepID=UPI001C041F88|nr:1-phosphofructokinase [Paludibacterium sp. B53371]BEV70804.1 1-phosphofructokinase [Paludibacterium sp. THUN1379]
MSNPIITVTLNPAIDQTVRLTQLHPGAVNAALDSQSHPGGKGVNVAGCLADWDIPVIATGILGRDSADTFAEMFHQKGIGNRFVLQPGHTRVNIKLSSEQNTTDINLPGVAVDPAVFARWRDTLDELAEPGRYIVLSGSLPTGIPDDCYARLCSRLADDQSRIILDTSGEPLRRALAGTTLPDCIKPNREELAQWAGHPLPEIRDILDTALSIHRSGVRQVIVSLGEQGALFVGEPGQWLARSAPQKPLSTVGAGDALLAGWVAAQHAGLAWEDSMRQAMAFAAGKLAFLGPNLPDRSTIDKLAAEVQLTRLPA